MATLLHYPLCAFSRSIRLALAECGIEADLVEEKPWEWRPELMALNPAGTLPVLVTDENQPIAGAYAISEYLADTADERDARLFYVPDAIAPWPAETVRWALDYAVGFFGGPASLREPVVAMLDLEPLLDVRIGHLSKGQRKRVLLALGLLTPSDVLLADEPFDGLDLRQSRDLARTLRHVAATGRTLFLSIHQIADAARVCDRFVLLSGGRVRGEGTLDELSALAAARGAVDGRDLEEVFLALT